MRLIRVNGVFCSDCYKYKDPRTGIEYEGMIRSLYDQSFKVRADRVRNPDKYPPSEEGGKFLNPDYISVEIEVQTCDRLGNNPKWCYEGNMQVINQSQSQSRLGNISPGRKCPSCGGEMKDRLCSTCGGYKVVGYTCVVCGKETGK